MARTGKPDSPVALPTTAIDGEFSVTAALGAVEALLGSRPPVLRIGQRRSDADGEPTLIVLDLETIGPHAPDGLAWTGWATLPLDSLDPVELRETYTRT